MDGYGELSFQNTVDCLPFDIHLGGKTNVDKCTCDEFIRNEGNNSTFKMTFTNISVEDTTQIDGSEVSLGNMMIQQGVTDLEPFLYPEVNDCNPVNLETSSIHVIDSGQENLPQKVSLLILKSSEENISRADVNIESVASTLEHTEIKNEANSKFSQKDVEHIEDNDVGREVHHAIENLLNHETYSSISPTNGHSEEQRLSPNEPLTKSENVKEVKTKGKVNKNKIGGQHECKICGKTFREKSHLATHSRAHIDIRNFSCDVCGLRFKNKANLYYHSQTHLETSLTCTQCGKTFTERKILKRHIRVVHSCKELHKCNQCEKTFKSAAVLSLHYTLHTGNKAFPCSMCPKSFVYKSTLAMHINQYHHQCTSCLPTACRHRVRFWQCTVCGKGYSLKASLNTHMKKHDPDKLFKCSECPKKFVKKQSYEVHLKLHKGEGPQYICDQCSMSYFNVFALRRHYLKHTSQRNFVCEICCKAFWMKDALKVHMRSHSNEKPFQCSKCHKAFAYKHTLEGHMKTHRSNQVQENKKILPPPLTTTAEVPPSLISSQPQHPVSLPLSTE